MLGALIWHEPTLSAMAGGGVRGGEDHAAGRKGQKGVGERWALVVRE